MPNNNSNPLRQPLSESLSYRDLDGIMKPTIHVDEFASKMGDDEDIIVLSFFLRDKEAARDLVAWFEKGYDFVLDADRSPGEIKPNRYLVYVEIRRRSSAPDNIERLLDDLGTLTEFDPDDWQVHYDGKTWPWSVDKFRSTVPLTPDAYTSRQEKDLNEWREAAGITPKPIYKKTRIDIQELKNAAGIA
jgi:hypothetical protein